jgi:D-cysteine desulfhydrase family pyridoxal phosphate-dependent enzyme
MLPRLRFAHLPTPVESLPRLSEALDGPQILVKRDDQTGLAFGGNKTRKLEFLLANAQERGADTLITTGAVQSNHCRQTAAAANRFGFACILVLTGSKPEIPSGNLMLFQFLGADVIWTEKSNRDLALDSTFENAIREGKKPYLIPYGGSNSIGASAFAYALQELLDQNMKPDWIVFATSSGGTQAGLVAGAHLFGFKGRILGISVDEQAAELKARVAALAEETAFLLGEGRPFSVDEILVDDNYLGAGYGIMGEPEIEALKAFSHNEGLLLDPVYTGRAAAGMIDLINNGFFSASQQVLFWHTGGTPVLFAENYRKSLTTGEV